MLVLVALAVFGGEMIHAFAIALLVGVFIGTYSSIYVASTSLLQDTSVLRKSASSCADLALIACSLAAASSWAGAVKGRSAVRSAARPLTRLRSRP